jgi:hypothetical protein
MCHKRHKGRILFQILTHKIRNEMCLQGWNRSEQVKLGNGGLIGVRAK